MGSRFCQKEFKGQIIASLPLRTPPFLSSSKRLYRKWGNNTDTDQSLAPWDLQSPLVKPDERKNVLGNLKI